MFHPGQAGRGGGAGGGRHSSHTNNPVETLSTGGWTERWKLDHTDRPGAKTLLPEKRESIGPGGSHFALASCIPATFETGSQMS